MKELILYAFVYYIVLAIICILLTVSDKKAAKAKKRRIPENVFMLLAAFGGALPMLLTMKAVHHKTRHKKFMLGLPLIILLQMIVLIAALFYLS